MDNLREGIDRIEAGYGRDHLNLVIAGGYVRSLLDNAAVESYLVRYHPELRGEFEKICEGTAPASEAAE